MDKKAKTAAELLNDIMQNPELVDTLSEEELTKVAAAHDPYNTVESDIVYANVSITNFRDKYMRRFYTTALIAYIYRMLAEYEPADLPETLTGDERRKRIQGVRDIVEMFLNYNFNYNPDRHLRSAKKESLSNAQIKKIIATGPTGDSSTIKDESKLPKVEKLKSDVAATLQAVSKSMVEISKSIKQLDEISKVMIESGLNADAFQDSIGILTKKYAELREVREEYITMLSAELTADTTWGVKRIPPADVFHHFDRYVTNHYEELRKLTEVLYTETPDIEFAVIYYAPEHKSEESAREFRARHQKDFKTDVYTIRSRGVNFLGPFKENRDRMDYYNKNTEILKQMMEQNEADSKIGNELMQKKVKVKKLESIKKVGPDSASLNAYSQTLGTNLEALGANKAFTKEEEEAIRKEHSAKKTGDGTGGAVSDGIETVPINEAIQIDVFKAETDESGEPTIKKSTFHSKVVVEATEPVEYKK